MIPAIRPAPPNQELPPGRFRGRTSMPFIILTKMEVRTAEELSSARDIDTADGVVHGRAGDIVVFAYGGERYPISPRIFFGSYEVLARIGPRMVARRLVQVRRAWNVLSAGSSFTYAPERGTVEVTPGSWLYQSDDNDFGIINPEVKDRSHSVVGNEEQLMAVDWQRRIAWRCRYLGFLPTVLTMISLLAFVTADRSGFEWLTSTCVALELALLLGGVAIVWFIRRDRWTLRAAAQSDLLMSREYQTAVTLLGHPSSSAFPGSAIWHAAQTPPVACPARSSQETENLVQRLKLQLAKTLQQIGAELKQDHARERMASSAATLAILTIIACNIYHATGSHNLAVSVFAIWLPSLIACIHAFVNLRYLTTRGLAMTTFHRELRFLQSQLFVLTTEGRSDTGDPREEDLRTTVQALCHAVGRFTQSHLCAVSSQSIEPPV